MATLFAPQVVERTNKIKRKPAEMDGVIKGKSVEERPASMFTRLHFGSHFEEHLSNLDSLFALPGKTANLGPVVSFTLRKSSEAEFLYFAYPSSWGAAKRIRANGFLVNDMESYQVDSFFVYRSPFRTTAIRIDFDVDVVIE
jgi:hypothetical protein